MQFDEKVLTALDVLRNAAENDFELHRIDVLERDLTSPPIPEVIDETHQRFDGVIYRKISSGHYMHNLSIHGAVWRYFNGEIPEGHDIHHSDFNKDNNVATNLEAKTKSEHRRIHLRARRARTSTCVICGKTFTAPLGAKYCSAKCHTKSKGTVKFCKHCGAEFVAFSSETVYCSRSCAMLDRPAEIRTCKQCGKEYSTVDRNGNFCSRKCYQRYVYRHNTEQRVCPICGKTFDAYVHGEVTYCSRECAAKAPKKKNN